MCASHRATIASGFPAGRTIWQQAEALVQRFKEAWRHGTPPLLADYLPPEGGLRAVVLVELVHTDLAFRLEAGEDIHVEVYLGRYPELDDDPTVAVPLIVAEFSALRQKQKEITPEDYLRRFPRHAVYLATRLFGEATGHCTPLMTVARSFEHIDPTGQVVVEDGGWPAVAGYELLEELGRGGMGIVYLARQVYLNRPVAVKMIRDGALAGPSAHLHFLAEVEVASAVRHSGIVEVHTFGTQQGQPFFVLEYCPGGSLARRLEAGPLPATEAARLVERVARAVQAAHEAGIVHRDLKPANILFDTTGQPKVTDFGLARRLESGGDLMQTGALVGTPAYMAPEQARGSKDVAPRADVWALGAILYEALTGHCPFEADTVLETIAQVLARDPAHPRSYRSELSLDLEMICLKCLSKEAARRYASAVELADDLGRFLEGKPTIARPVGLLERGRMWARRNWTVAALGSLAMMLLCGMMLVGVLMVQARCDVARADAQVCAARLLVESEVRPQTPVPRHSEDPLPQDERTAVPGQADAQDACPVIPQRPGTVAKGVVVLLNPREQAEARRLLGRVRQWRADTPWRAFSTANLVLSGAISPWASLPAAALPGAPGGDDPFTAAELDLLLTPGK